MRTFIAIPLSDRCRALLETMQFQLRSAKPDVTWTAVSSIHITLKFLGEINPAVLPSLIEALEGASASEAPFAVKLQGLGTFPNIPNPRIVWCGVRDQSGNLGRLQQKVETACTQLGFTIEEKPFHPHLTLGRVRGKRNLQPLLDCIKIGMDLECDAPIDHYNVYKSTLTSDGAIHGILKSIDLGGSLPQPGAPELDHSR
jgi:RNA 2',3'-cyclic 3'-phosphodiesterase